MVCGLHWVIFCFLFKLTFCSYSKPLILLTMLTELCYNCNSVFSSVMFWYLWVFSCLCFRCFLVTSFLFYFVIPVSCVFVFNFRSFYMFSSIRLAVPISPPASSSRDRPVCPCVYIHIVPVESIFGSSFLTCFYCCSYSKMILILSFKSKFLSFTKGRFSCTNINKITLCLNLLFYYFIYKDTRANADF